MSKTYLYNPNSGAPIKNWYDGSERWSLAVDEVKAFPKKVAQALKDIYGFLQEINEQEFEQRLAKLEEKEKNPTTVKIDASGDLVPKAESEIRDQVEEIKKEKDEVKKVLNKVKKAPEAEPENPHYEEWSRGEVFTEVNKRGLEIKGVGKGHISKDFLINILVNDDANK